MLEKMRVLLVDDHAMLRSGLRALLRTEPDIFVVGEAGTGEEGIDKTKELRPDIVVMDLSMPGMGGLAAIKAITELGMGTRVLVLTMHAEEEYLLAVLEAGGSGYVRKTSADQDLVNALRTVARDEVFLYPSAAKLLLQGFKTKSDEHEPTLLDKLTERERVVLQQTVQGFSSSEIGEKLFISPKTVDTYRARVMEKLGLNHRSQLVRFALDTGLLKPK
jgi:two-component system, NarL family, response regulator NreC